MPHMPHNVVSRSPVSLEQVGVDQDGYAVEHHCYLTTASRLQTRQHTRHITIQDKTYTLKPGSFQLLNGSIDANRATPCSSSHMFEALNPKPKEKTEAWYSKLSTPRRKEETHTRLATRTKHQGYMKRKPTYNHLQASLAPTSLIYM